MARAIIDTALDAFVQLDDTGTVIGWSPKAEEMFGWSRQEVIGRKLATCLFRRKIAKRFRRGSPNFS